MKVRSLYHLEAMLDQDLAWRKREFTTIKFMIKNARQHEKVILYKSAVAHWEGYLKNSSQAYACYLNHVAPKYGEMKDNFLQSSLADKFSQGFSFKKYPFQKEIFEYIKCATDMPLKINEKRVVDTESNLKSHVLFNIMKQLALDTNIFELKENFIDVIMVDNRNKIAHGEKIDSAEVEEAYCLLESELLEMIMSFQSTIISSAANKYYLK